MMPEARFRIFTVSGKFGRTILVKAAAEVEGMTGFKAICMRNLRFHNPLNTNVFLPLPMF